MKPSEWIKNRASELGQKWLQSIDFNLDYPGPYPRAQFEQQAFLEYIDMLPSFQIPDQLV